MKKFKQLLSLFLVIIFILSGCANSKNKLDTNETTPQQESSSIGQEETSDISVNNGTLSYNYDISLYDDGRVFDSNQIAIQSEFESFLSKVFVEEKSENTISLHFSIENPEDYGIPDFDATWGDFDYLNFEEALTEYNDLLTQVTGFEYSALTYEQQLIYDIFKEFLEDQIASTKYYLFNSCFSPISGSHSELPIIFSEYDFIEKDDIDDYISLLQKSNEYIEKLCEYEKYRLEKGYSLSPVGLEKVINQCKDFLSTEPNCLLPVFKDKLDAFSSLSEDEKQAYIEAFENGLKNSLIPSYELIISTLTEIKSSPKCLNGLCNYTDGKLFYEYLVRQNTGSDKSVDELYKLMEKEMSKSITSFSLLYAKRPNLLEDMENFEYPTDDPDEMLKSLITSLKEDFPDAVNNSYTINYVPESLESTMSPAFYLIPPIDNINRNIIYINEGEDYASMNLFPTIAHEGFPGHMYQTNYFYSLNPHYFRSLLSFNGYSEGWAHYIESCYSYKYSGMDNDLAKGFEYNQSLSFALYCMADIGINYYGWDYEETKKFVSKYIGPNDETVKEIYYTMIDDPTVYMRYYVGYLEIINLKELAKKQLGDGFEIKEFHKFLLQIGPCQFEIIEDRMEKWIEQVKK